MKRGLKQFEIIQRAVCEASGHTGLREQHVSAGSLLALARANTSAFDKLPSSAPA